MALQADFFAALRGQAGRVDDLGALRVGGVLRAGAVAALAIDCGAAIVCGMAEQARRRDLAAEVGVSGAVEARTHRPMSAIPGVPAYRQLEKPAIGRLAQEAASVSAGADCIVDAGLKDVALSAAITFLPAANVVGAV